MESKKVLFAWNPRDSCFALERPCFGGVDLSKTEVIGALGITRWGGLHLLEIWNFLRILPWPPSPSAKDPVHKFMTRIFFQMCSKRFDFFQGKQTPRSFFFLEKKVLSRPSNWKKQTNTSETKGVVCEPFVSDEKKMRLFDFPSSILSECYQFVSCNAGAWCWPGCWLRFRAAQQWKFPCSRSEGCIFQKMCLFPIHKMWLLDIWPGFQWDCCFCGPSLGETHSSRVVSEGL